MTARRSACGSSQLLELLRLKLAIGSKQLIGPASGHEAKGKDRLWADSKVPADAGEDVLERISSVQAIY